MLNPSDELIIKDLKNDIRPGARKTHYGEWVGEVNLYVSGEFFATLVTSEDCYPSEEKAVKKMKQFIEETRNGTGGT